MASIPVAVGAALIEPFQWGLLHRLDGPLILEWTLGIGLMDLANYSSHRLSHRVPLLWRFHRVHHSDPELDVTTHFRHHPGEMILVWPLYASIIWSIPRQWWSILSSRPRPGGIPQAMVVDPQLPIATRGASPRNWRSTSRR